MPNYNEFFGTTLKVDDIRGREVRVVIEEVTLEQIKGEHGMEKKLVVHFLKTEKGLVLNRSNADTIAQLAGTPQTEEWGGTVLILYVDENVTFGGKKVGGIRCKAPAKRPAAPVAPPPPTEIYESELPDDPPF